MITDWTPLLLSIFDAFVMFGLLGMIYLVMR